MAIPAEQAESSRQGGKSDVMATVPPPSFEVGLQIPGIAGNSLWLVICNMGKRSTSVVSNGVFRLAITG